jgi:hypothetical protein
MSRCTYEEEYNIDGRRPVIYLRVVVCRSALIIPQPQGARRGERVEPNEGGFIAIACK